jgi:hypothetical protein
MAYPEDSAAPDATAAQAPDAGGNFDQHIDSLGNAFRQHQAIAAELQRQRASQPPPPPNPQLLQAQQVLMQGSQALQKQQQAVQSALQAATQNLDPIQRAALGLKLHQNALALATGQTANNHLDMPLDPRSALLSSTYGPGGGATGDPFGGAGRILASLGPNAQMPKSTLSVYHELHAARPHRTIIQFSNNPPAPAATASAK